MKKPPKPKVFFCNDGGTVEKIPQSLHSLLRKNGVLGTDKISFCGFVTTGNEILISLPKGKVAPTMSNASVLFKALIKYSRKKLTAQSGLEEPINTAPLSLFWEILENWRIYGLYRKSKKETVITFRGKVNWSKTVSRFNPFIGSDSIPVYPEVISSYTNHKHITLIQRIQLHVLHLTNLKFGWLIEPNKHDQHEFLQHELPPCSTQQAIHELRKELRSQFAHNKIQTLKLLLRYYEKKNGNESDIFGVKQFWPIWEAACAGILNHDSNVIIPQPKYIKSDGKPSRRRGDNIGQRHDIFFIEKDRVAVVDAKYYDISVSLPGWHDICKQFHYRNSFKCIGYQSVTNCFVLPDLSDKPHLKTTHIEMTRDGFDSSRLDLYFGKIHCIYREPNNVLEKWINNKIDDQLRNEILDLEST